MRDERFGESLIHRKTKMKTVEITLVLTDAQAWEFAQFLKQVCFSDYCIHATSEEGAYHMVHAGERVRSALADKGCAPR